VHWDNTTLTKLALANNLIMDEGLKGLLRYPHRLQNLSLDYAGLKLGYNCADTLGILKTFTGLKSLILTGNKMTDEVLLCVLATTPGYLGRLSCLSLNSCGLTGNVMYQLGEYVRGNTSLTDLNLGCNPLKNCSEEIWHTLLEDNCRIQTLSLDNAHLGCNRLRTFRLATNDNTSLTSLTIFRNPVNKGGAVGRSLAHLLEVR
jgi:hypothetical protein